MTLRRAIYDSRNTIAIKLGMELGRGGGRRARRPSSASPPAFPPCPSIHIGSADVLPLDMIAAYTTFANLGMRSFPLGILRVEDRRARSSGSPPWRCTR